MLRFKNIFAELMLGLVVSTIALADNTGIVNVLDFGAKGDGKTDDTAAIQKAMQAAAMTARQPPAGGSYYVTGPVLLFPAGEYIISDEIEILCLEIKGVGGASLRQLNDQKNIFYSDHAWKLSVNNLSFINGHDHLHLCQPNVDAGEIYIEDCSFYNAAGVAVHTDVLSETVKIQDCQFIKCYQSWINLRTDQAVMRDCWITNSWDMKDKAVIEHGGQRMTIENLTGVSLVAKGSHQRWIDQNGADLTVRACRFGGEGGGFTPIYNLRKYIPTGSKAFDASMGVNIIVDDCFVCGGIDQNYSCAVYCREIPNSVVVQNSVLVNGPALKVAENIDLNNYFVNVSPQRLLFQSQNNTALPNHSTSYADINDPDYADKIPPLLANPKITPKPVPGIAIQEVKEKLKEIAQNLPPADKAAHLANGHKQKLSPDEYVDLTFSIFPDPNENLVISDTRCLFRVSQFLIAYMRTNAVEPKHLLFKGKVNLDKYPWLTWKQLTSNTSGSFTVQVKDITTQKVYDLYKYTQYDNIYGYHAVNLKKKFSLSGTRELQINWFLCGWDRNPQKDEHWDSIWAWPGQYTVLEFVRFEKP